MLSALDDVSFSFESGKIYGFLGRNGAGKSTLINIIANRIFADSGEVLIDGQNARENMKVHEKIFCMSEADLYAPELKVRDHFKWISRFYDSFDMKQGAGDRRKIPAEYEQRSLKGCPRDTSPSSN